MTSRPLIKGLALAIPFVLILALLALGGPRFSRFFARVFAGPSYEDHLHGPFTIFGKKGSSEHETAAQVLMEFTDKMVEQYGAELRLEKPDAHHTPIAVYLLESQRELADHGFSELSSDLSNNGGYFLASKRKIALVVTHHPAADARGLRHEMMHALLALSRKSEPWPVWLDEGMASYFETRLKPDTPWHGQEAAAARPIAGEPLALADVLHSKSGDFTSEKNRLFYLSSHLLFAYLFERRWEKFVRFFQSGAGPDAFTQEFGEPRDVEREWHEYVRSRK